MTNAIILHGRPTRGEYYSDKYPSCSNSHWLPWLQKQLLIKDIFAQTPEVPMIYKPTWQSIVKEVERFEITADTLLVGHSLGGGFWVRYLSENPELKVGKVILVAPWIDVEKDDPQNLFDFKIDPKLASRTKGLVIFNSTDDGQEIQSSVKELRKKLTDLKYREFQNLGHFTHSNLPDDKFPELLEECLK